MSEPPEPPPPPDSGVATAPSIQITFRPGAERFVIVGLSGPAEGLEIEVGPDEVILGRARSCLLRINDDQVSRQHVRLTRLSDVDASKRAAVLIEDLGSRNGIQVDGEKTKRAVLRGGEKIVLGRSVLRIDRRDDIDVAHDAQRRAQALRDPLTGLGNRQALREAIDRAENARQSEDRPYAVLVIDLDHFKQVNDRFGHPGGDAALCHAARTVVDVLRASDTAFRLGGEEFVVILPDADVGFGHVVAERIRAAIEARPVAHEGNDIELTASVGVAAGGPQAIDRADRALYDAKHGGRNRVCDASAED